MSKSILALFTTLFSLVFIVIVIGSYVIVAQTAITGQWKADARNKGDEKDGKIQLNFERRTAKGDRNQNGFSIPLDELQGLSRDQLQNGKVNFRLIREAGTVECEGLFSDGRGSGTFRFLPNPEFLSSMKTRGSILKHRQNTVTMPRTANLLPRSQRNDGPRRRPEYRRSRPARCSTICSKRQYSRSIHALSPR